MPEQKITVEEALRAYTRGAAYASFEENDKGTLAPGKLADLVIIDKDLRKVPASGDPEREDRADHRRRPHRVCDQSAIWVRPAITAVHHC